MFDWIKDCYHISIGIPPCFRVTLRLYLLVCEATNNIGNGGLTLNELMN